MGTGPFNLEHTDRTAETIEAAAPRLPHGLTLRLCDEHITLLPERAAFWHREKTLLVADLHFGKAETFRVHGASVPAGELDAALARLTRCIEMCNATRVLILGDLLHASAGITPTLVSHIQAWRAQHHHIDFGLIAGNHDRAIDRVAAAWKLGLLGECLYEGPFAFVHVPQQTEAPLTWAGHIHPAITLRSRGDSVRLPCYHIGPRVAVLPAFSTFTSGAGFTREAQDRVFAIAENRILEV